MRLGIAVAIVLAVFAVALAPIFAQAVNHRHLSDALAYLLWSPDVAVERVVVPVGFGAAVWLTHLLLCLFERHGKGFPVNQSSRSKP